MNGEKLNLVEELRNFFRRAKELDGKTVAVFLIVAVFQTVVWYYWSRKFFRATFGAEFGGAHKYLYEYMYWFLGSFVMYFALPILVVRIAFKERLVDWGVGLGDKKLGFVVTGIFLLVMAPILWVASSSPEFAKVYPHYAPAKIQWEILLVYEFGMLLYMIGWEYVWRGFMLFGLYPKFGYYAVLIQMMPFLILHNGKPAPETFGAIIAGVALGALALRTRSFWYCAFTHFGVMFMIDVLSTLRYRVNDYGLGLDSFFNLFNAF
jgi:uncharacterized protein